jgi:hypothetical protein
LDKWKAVNSSLSIPIFLWMANLTRSIWVQCNGSFYIETLVYGAVLPECNFSNQKSPIWVDF